MTVVVNRFKKTGLGATVVFTEIKETNPGTQTFDQVRAMKLPSWKAELQDASFAGSTGPYKDKMAVDLMDGPQATFKIPLQDALPAFAIVRGAAFTVVQNLPAISKKYTFTAILVGVEDDPADVNTQLTKTVTLEVVSEVVEAAISA